MSAGVMGEAESAVRRDDHEDDRNSSGVGGMLPVFVGEAHILGDCGQPMNLVSQRSGTAS